MEELLLSIDSKKNCINKHFLCMYVYVYVYMYMCVCVYIYIYIYKLDSEDI